MVAVLVTSVISLTLLPMARFSHWLLSKRSHCSLPICSKRLPHKVPVGPGVSSSSFFFAWCRHKNEEWLMILHLQLLNLCAAFSFVLERPNTSTMFWYSFSTV
jgi:hypothetical protein